MNAYGIHGSVERADETSTQAAISKALFILEQGGAVAFVSDAGTPSISDPGQRLAAAIVIKGFEVFSVPGASSVLAALVVSGLDARQFAFLGFIPNKNNARLAFIESALKMPMTTIMFETGPRLLASLEILATLSAERQIVVARELTKLFEEKRRGTSLDIFSYYKVNGPPKGEIVIVLSQAPIQDVAFPSEDLEEKIIVGLKSEGIKNLSERLARETGLKKREIYQLALSLSKGGT
jgi:16S rRNA (cytidine1402-2'-O)-methyltransferase